jgi:hypothetical protein
MPANLLFSVCVLQLQDEKRKQAMFQRRAAPLQAVLDQISPRAYEGTDTHSFCLTHPSPPHIPLLKRRLSP